MIFLEGILIYLPVCPIKKRVEQSSICKLETRVDAKFTEKQGQYLSFIAHYIMLNVGLPPSQIFSAILVTPPTVHQMVVKLETWLGLLEPRCSKKYSSRDISGRCSRLNEPWYELFFKTFI